MFPEAVPKAKCAAKAAAKKKSVKACAKAKGEKTVTRQVTAKPKAKPKAKAKAKAKAKTKNTKELKTDKGNVYSRAYHEAKRRGCSAEEVTWGRLGMVWSITNGMNIEKNRSTV